jgi:2-polyprenyl-3-methyl-5-hydroxy-6-metoxy-1,4-benzoquinol methylase
VVAELDQTKVDAFTHAMTGFLNGGTLALMTSIGHQTGLFETLATLPPSTSRQIADAAGLNERYVREWLNTMATGKIVTYAPESRTYALPAEHAAVLTKAAGPGNMAIFARMIPILSAVEPGIIDSFRRGGGVFYDQFQDFMALWAGVNEQTFESTLVPKAMPLMPEVAAALNAGIEALDIGCGEGHSTNVLAKAYPHSRFTGYDLRDRALEEARAKAASLGLHNVRFVRQDLSTLEERGAYELVTAFDVIHDQAQPRTVLRNVATALKQRGTFLMVDIKASSNVHENLDHPMGPFLYTISTMHCMTVSLARHGEGLGAMWGEQKALELLAEAGFTDVTVKQVEGDFLNNFYIARKH